MKTSLRILLGVGLAVGWLTVMALPADVQPLDDKVRQLYNLPPTNAAPVVAVPVPVAPVPTAPVPTAPVPTAPSQPSVAAQVQPTLSPVPTAPPAPVPTPPAPPQPGTVPTDLGATPTIPGGAEADEIIPLVIFGSDQTIEAAIKTLARQANLNLHLDPKNLPTVTGPDGKPTVAAASVRWENVTARQALEELLDVNGLALMLSKNKFYRVVPKPTTEPKITHVFQLKFANPTNMVVVVSNSFPNLKAIHDIRTSQMVVTATENDLMSVSNLLAMLDLPTKQVLIEAQIYETSKSPSTIKGIDWAGTLEAQNVSFGNGNTSFSSTRESPATASQATLPGGRPVSVTGGDTTRSTANTLLEPANGLIGFTANTARGFNPNLAFLNADGARAVLSFLNKETDSEVLATPKAVTVDNEPATLQVTRAYPIFKITPGTSQSPAGSEIQYTNLGTILTVTPRISANKTVAMKVVPEVSSIDSKDRQTINGQLNEANVYAIRKIEANVLVPSGSTLVMGGLISDNRSSIHSKVPILGDLPGLGMAFRRQGKSRTKSNLLIFVTPTIVQESDYQPAQSTFLQSKPSIKPDVEDNAWDSGKPHDWLKPVK